MRIAADAQRGSVSLRNYFNELLPEEEQDERSLDGFFNWLDAEAARDAARAKTRERD